MHVIIYHGFWDVNKVRNHPDYLFVFGDNDKKSGKGGQAIIRDESNAIGIPTKKYPCMKYFAFYTDEEYKENISKIDEAIKRIQEELSRKNYTAIVIPVNGFGTGLAQLSTKAPQTFSYLKNTVNTFVDKIQPDVSSMIIWE